ncbi:MAG: hypothetical protein COC12_09105 [Rhodobacteraceae bacterium]|nr:MAG: hypothetical protein COC12_09105 [Paracoccaceae bacterium]
MTTELARRGTARWEAGAELIENVYDNQYGAVIPAHADEMILATNQHGKIIAATGLREAKGDFFSQIYLNTPVEAAISKGLNLPVKRDEILEVVTLATATPTAILPLFAGVVIEGQARGKTYCMFTATSRLRQIFRKLKMELIELAPADPARMDNAGDWGRYYATNPVVCAISAEHCSRHHTRFLRAAA